MLNRYLSTISRQSVHNAIVNQSVKQSVNQSKMSTMVGGKGDVKAADHETQTLVDGLRSDIESKANQTFKQFTAVEKRQQVVSSVNSFMF
jgi:hypothetical protein